MPELFALLGRLGRRAAVLLRWRRHQEELREEIAQHAALRQLELEVRGLPSGEAAAAASRAMGNVTVQREQSHGIWMLGWLSSVHRDLAFALRSMRRQPAFSAAAVLGLAAGLGFSAAAFTAYNAFMLRGWDVREPSRLVALYATSTGAPGNRRASGFTIDQMRAFAADARTIDGVISYEKVRPDGTGGITAAPVSASYFGVLGVPMALGRPFSADEDRIGAPAAVVVISHDWWTRQYGADSDVLGRVERVRGVPFTIIGVAREGFGGTDFGRADAWIPLTAMPLVRPRDGISLTALAQSDRCCVHLAARLAPAVTRREAETELTTILERMRRPDIDTLVRSVTTRDFTTGGTSGPNVNAEMVPLFLMIFAGVGVIQLLACANVANLLLARAASREREIGVRLALGASRARLVRQLMTESLLLAMFAAVPALALAQWLPPWIVRLLTTDALTLRFTPDARVLLVLLALTVVSCVLFGLAPALHATRRVVPQRTRVPLRSVFLSAQVTFCMVLLGAAGLLVRSAREARSVDMGFEVAGLSEVMITLPANEDASAGLARLRNALPALVEAAGLRQVAFVAHPPFAVLSSQVRFGAEDRDLTVPTIVASPEYFAVARLPLLAGRIFRADSSASGEIVVNALLAESLGGATAAVGRTLVVDSVPRTVVGVVPTARDVDLRVAQRALYVNYRWRSAPRLLVRATEAEAQRLGIAVRSINDGIGVSVRPYQWYIENELSGATAAAAMAGAMGLLALVLASVGIFGVFSFWVRQRQRDIGIRMALGATRGHVLGLVLGASARAMVWGLAIGTFGAIGVALGLRSALYGVSTLDPLTIGSALMVMVVTSLLATALPAWRAVHVNPVDSLRED